MLKEYLESIKDLTENNELTHRPSLYNLLNRLKTISIKNLRLNMNLKESKEASLIFAFLFKGLTSAI
ncbi:hypothetical protein JP0143_04830 [Helicobacter pylori]